MARRVMHRAVSFVEAAAPVVSTIARRPRVSVGVRKRGAPVAGAAVRLVGFAGDARLFELADARAIDAPNSILCYAGVGPARLVAATTNEEGIATLRPPPEWPGPIWLVVDAPGHRPVLRPFAVFAGQAVEVAIEQDARVAGCLVPGAPNERSLRVVASPHHEDAGLPRPIVAAPEPDVDGAFALSLAPGSYDIWAFALDGHHLLATMSVAAGEQRTIGDLRLPR